MIKRFNILVFTIALFTSSLFSYGGTIPAGLPTTFSFGAIDKYDNAGGDTPTRWKEDQGNTCWDFDYNYLTSGWEGWQSPNGQWAMSELLHWQGMGQETLFTYYYNNGSTSMLNNPGTMTSWYNNLTTLLKGINTNVTAGKVAIIHIEPDLLGFCETGGMSASSTVAVASTGNADLAGIPNTLAGWWQAIIVLRNKYCTTTPKKALIAIHYSHWASDDVFNSTTITQGNLNTAVDTVSNFLKNVMGSYPADLVAAESSDRDADWYAHVKSDTTRWANMDLTTPPSLPGHKTWGRIAYIVDRLSTNLGLRAILWQIPVGNTFFKTCNNSDGHYRDNASQAILPCTSATGASGSPGDAYSSSSTTTGPGYWAAHGVIAVFFGEGAYNWVDSGANVTHLRDYGPTDGTVNGTSQFNTTGGGVTGDFVPAGTSSSTDNDGGYVRQALTWYCGHTKYAIGAQPTVTKTWTTGPTFTRTPSFTVTPFICAKVIYDGDNAGTNLAAGGVTNNSPATMTEGAAGGNPGNGMILNYVLPAATPYWQPLLWTPSVPMLINDNTTLRFEVKSSQATAPVFTIVIDWGSTTYQIDVNNYVTGGITNTWQTAVIPLSVLKAAGTTSITFVDFINGNNTSYTVYVDNIRLTGGACPSATPTISATYTRTRTMTVTPTGTNSSTVLPSATYTSTRTATPTYTGTPTRTNTVAIPTATFTFTRTPTFTYSVTNTPLPATMTYTATATRTPTNVPPTGTFTATYSLTSTRTATPTFTSTSVPPSSPTFTPTRTGTPTYTATGTNTPTPTISNTWTPGFGTQTNTPTITLSWTRTVTPTYTATAPPESPTFTGTRTATPTFTPPATVTYTRTIGPSATPTDIVPSSTFTCTRTNTPTIVPSVTVTPSYTRTYTATRTATATYTSTKLPSPTFTETEYVSPTVTYTVDTGTQPDLIITGMEITLLSIPACPDGSEQPGTMVSFRNSGNADAGPFDVELNGQIINVPGLVTGGSGSVWFAGQATQGNATAVIDFNSAVAESNETNNDYTQYLPDPTPVDTCTPVVTDTFTPTETPTDLPTGTDTPEATETCTEPATPVETFTMTGTAVPAATFTRTPGATATQTSVIPQNTPYVLAFTNYAMVTAFPNPVVADNDWHFSFEINRSAETAEFYLYSASLRKIRQISIPRGSVINNLSQGKNGLTIGKDEIYGLSAGVYYYYVVVGTGNQSVRSKTDKIIIIK